MFRFVTRHWLELALLAACGTLAVQMVLGAAGMEQVFAVARNWMWPIIWGAHLTLIAVLIGLWR